MCKQQMIFFFFYLMIKLHCKNVNTLNNFEDGDLFSQSLGVDTLPLPEPKPGAEFNYSVGFKDLNGKHNFFSYII